MDEVAVTLERRCQGFRFSVRRGGKEVARAFLYVLGNDLHEEPFGLMEDVYVDPHLRGKSIGSSLVVKLIEKARSLGCYKLIATSRRIRVSVHRLYIDLGFKEYGKEFRMNLKQSA
ncbi:MAG: GNAT family N-acetyltransferase [Patescibacteria group bacterium]